MPRRDVQRLITILLGAVTLFGCSDQSPTAPRAGQQSYGSRTLTPATIIGSYQLSFYVSGPTGLEAVSSLPVSTSELILGVHVQDQFGNPAMRGSVTFQYCSLKGFPPNDITRADEAPSSSCADGSAAWATLRSISVDQNGNAYLDFGIVQIPRVVGFRCQYQPRGGAIPSGACAPADFTWTATP